VANLRKDKIVLVSFILISLLLFFAANQLTPNPGQSSGNGNPAILILLILLPILCYMVVLLVKLLEIYSIKPSLYLSSIFLIVLHWIVGFLYQHASIVRYREILSEAYNEIHGFVDWEYILQITSVLSIHVNNQYFNINTYFMFLSLSLLLAILIVHLRKTTKRRG
jgi:hypothetical protein